MMNLYQTKLIGLTMELELKTKEYQMLCDRFNKLKDKNIDPNDERLLPIKDLFQRNHDEIAEITNNIKELKENS